jgi:HPr kinase/phosphorylase
MTNTQNSVKLHATCVDIAGRGVMITGKSGAGKSRLAMELVALGAVLVGDDQTELSVVDGALQATAPASIRGLIEARGIGIIEVPVINRTEIKLIVNMDQVETERLPNLDVRSILGVQIPVIKRWPDLGFGPSVFLAAKYGLKKDV